MVRCVLRCVQTLNLTLTLALTLALTLTPTLTRVSRPPPVQRVFSACACTYLVRHAEQLLHQRSGRLAAHPQRELQPVLAQVDAGRVQLVRAQRHGGGQRPALGVAVRQVAHLCRTGLGLGRGLGLGAS